MSGMNDLAKIIDLLIGCQMCIGSHMANNQYVKNP